MTRKAENAMDKVPEYIPPPRPATGGLEYAVGINVQPGPDEREVRNMFFLVAYDIASPNRLRKVAKICESYGIRVEKSVFECDLPPEQFENLWCALIDIVVEDEDAVVAYSLCQRCVRRTESIGVIVRPKVRFMYCL